MCTGLNMNSDKPHFDDVSIIATVPDITPAVVCLMNTCISPDFSDTKFLSKYASCFYSRIPNLATIHRGVYARV